MEYLKLGSQGLEVKALQVYLNSMGFRVAESGPGSPGFETETFGKLTEAALIRFQTSKNIRPTGIVGPQTRAAMGFLDADDQYQEKNKNWYAENNIKIAHLPRGEYIDKQTRKEYLFYHHTGGWEIAENVIHGWAKDNRGQIATEFVISGQSLTKDTKAHDGRIVQAFPTGRYAWHLGGTGSQYMHTNSIGIEVCSHGALKKHTDGHVYSLYAWDFKNFGPTYRAHPNQVVELSNPYKGFSLFHKYSDGQLESLKKLTLAIAERDSIDVRAGVPTWIRNEGVDKAFAFRNDAWSGKVKGLLVHGNVRQDKHDMYPQQELIDMILSL
jgi:N-acetyl-anhydromuramyl-L-alanine amidase AmpD